MTTWAEIVSEIRVDLRDPSGTKYPDASILVWLKDAIRDYSRHFPYESTVKLTKDDEGDFYALPSGTTQVNYVMCPSGTYLEEKEPRPGVAYITQSTPTLYYQRGGAIYLNGSTEEDVYVVANCIHNVPTSEDWDSEEEEEQSEVTIPDMDIELIRLYVKAKANESTRTRQANLDRFKSGSGSRDDNPLEPEVEGLMDEYRKKILERYPVGVIFLYKPGNRRK